jgi:hypothetical protein
VIWSGMSLQTQFGPYRFEEVSYSSRCSLLSASAFTGGHMKQDPALRNKGVELYSKAIQLMSLALEPSRLAKRDAAYHDLLMTGFALAVYEVSSLKRTLTGSCIWQLYPVLCPGQLLLALYTMQTSLILHYSYVWDTDEANTFTYSFLDKKHPTLESNGRELHASER